LKNMKMIDRKEQRKKPFTRLAAAALLTGAMGCTMETDKPHLYNIDAAAGPGQCFINEVRVRECEMVSSEDVRISDTLAIATVGFKVITVEDVDQTKSVVVHAMEKHDMECAVLDSTSIKPGETKVLSVDNHPYDVRIEPNLFYDGSGANITMSVTPDCYEPSN